MDDETFSVKLVQEVEKHPVLYNYKLSDYSKRDVVDLAWENVGRRVNDTAANCKEKWRNIRTVFTRKLKIPKSGSGKQKKYYLMDYLQFLVPFLGNKSNVSGNVPSPSESLSSTEPEHEFSQQFTNDSSSNNPSEQGDPEVPKRPFKKPKNQTNRVDDVFVKYMEEKSRQPKEEDSRRMFLLSLLPDVQKLSDQKMRQFRRQVLEVLDSLLEDTPKPTSSSLPTLYQSNSSSAQQNVPSTPSQPYSTHIYTSTPSDSEGSLADYYQSFSNPNLTNL